MNKKLTISAILAMAIASTFTFACRGVPGPCNGGMMQNTTMQQVNHPHMMWVRRGMGMRRGRMGGMMYRQIITPPQPSRVINQYPTYQISDDLKKMLYNQYGEEKMARDLYQYAYEKYGLAVFANIARSEQQHMNAVGALLAKYGVTPPSDYAKDNQLYQTLKAKIDEGLEQALNVGVTVEEVDIDDIAKQVKQAYDEWAKDVVQVLTNIAGGSYNHLRGFLMALKQNGYTLPDVSNI